MGFVKDNTNSGKVATMQVKLFGPNLSNAAQKKGTFHVHAAGCGDCKHYGPGRKFGGEDAGMTVDAASEYDVSEFIYADHAGDDYEPGSPEWVQYIEDAVSDFHFAPCVKFSAPKKAAPKPTGGVVSEAKSRQTGTVVRVIDNRDRHLCDSGEFIVECVDHGALNEFDTKTAAMRFRPVPREWCPDCQAQEA